MAEINNIIAEASKDLQTIEDFVNLPAGSDVRPRLLPSVNVGTLAGVRQAIFEAGGLPATPFKTKADMEASDLPDGSYAVATDDSIDKNNGIYRKDSGAWVSTGFNPIHRGEFKELEGKLLFEKSLNLFDGVYYPYMTTKRTDELGDFGKIARRHMQYSGSMVIFPVEGNTEYTISVLDSSNAFRLAAFDDEVFVHDTVYVATQQRGRIILYNDTTTTHTFTTEPNDKWITLLVSDKGDEPRIQFNKGSKALGYSEPYLISNVMMPTLAKAVFPHLVHEPKNIFNGKYQTGMLFNQVDRVYPVRNYDSYNGRTAVIKVEPNTTYTISSPDRTGISPFRIGLSKELRGFTNRWDAPLDTRVLHATTYSSPVTFTTGDNEKYLYIYVSNKGDEPRLQVEKGEQATEYSELYTLHESAFASDVYDLEVSSNKFNGSYINAYLKVSELGTDDGTVYHSIVADAEHPNSVTGVAEVEPLTEYTLSIRGEFGNTDNLFLQASLWNTNPVNALNNVEVTGRSVREKNNDLQVTFTTGELDRFLVFYINDIAEHTKAQLEIGDTPTEYKEHLVIPSRKLGVYDSKSSGSGTVENPVKLPNGFPTDFWGLESLPTRLNPPRRYNFPVDLHGFYRRQGELENFFTNPNGITAPEVHERFQQLASEHPDYFEFKSIGLAEYDYEMYLYETKPMDYVIDQSGYIPSMTDSIKMEQPTFFITSGIHGRERAANYSVYYFFKELLENPQNDPVLEFIKNNVKFYIIPLVSPSGFDDNAYGNRNMNLNRDFPPQGKATQAETGIVISEMSKVGHIDFHFDFHNSNGQSGSKMGYALTDYRELAQLALATYQRLGLEWASEHEGIVNNPKYAYGYTAPANIGTVGKFSQEVLGLRSTIFETYYWVGGVDTVKTGETKNGETVTRLGVDLMANMVIGALRSVVR